MKFRNKYDYESMKAGRPVVRFEGPKAKSLTNQSDLKESDINHIMAKYEKTGVITVNGQERTPMYGDFSEAKDLHASLSLVRRVESAFLALPASLRARFENDPARLLEFIDDPKNREEAVRLGLVDGVRRPDALDPSALAKKASAAPAAEAPATGGETPKASS